MRALGLVLAMLLLTSCSLTQTEPPSPTASASASQAPSSSPSLKTPQMIEGVFPVFAPDALLLPPAPTKEAAGVAGFSAALSSLSSSRLGAYEEYFTGQGWTQLSATAGQVVFQKGEQMAAVWLSDNSSATPASPYVITLAYASKGGE